MKQQQTFTCKGWWQSPQPILLDSSFPSVQPWKTHHLFPAPPTQNWEEKQISLIHSSTHPFAPKIVLRWPWWSCRQNPTSKPVPKSGEGHKSHNPQMAMKNKIVIADRWNVHSSLHHNLTYSLPDPFFNPPTVIHSSGFPWTDNPTHTSPPNLLSISWSARGVCNCARYAVQILRKSKGG